jgi:hypothetical protein
VGRTNRSSIGLVAWPALAFVVSEAVARALGVRFADNTLGSLYQYLDPEILRNDLARGLYYLHAQPPLFNLFLGGVLQWFPGVSRVVFSVLYGSAALGLLIGMAWLMDRFGVPRMVHMALCLVMASTPNFVVYRHWLFYTLPVAFLLVAGAVVLARYVETGRAAYAHGFSWCAAILMLTRAVYHPAWWVAVLAVVALTLGRPRRKTLLVSAIAPLVVVHLWFFKNYVQVGSFSGSTWLGMNLAKRWPLSQTEMRDLYREGHLPPVWHRRPFREPDELRHYGYFGESLHVHPALDAPYKENGEPNFNHRDYVRISREMLRGDIYLMRHFPDRYLERVVTALLLYLQPGPNSVHFLVDYDFTRVHRLKDWLTRYVFWGGEIERPIRMFEPPLNLLMLVFPALVIFGGVVSFRRRCEEPDRRAVFAYMVSTIVWVTLTTNLIEIGENDRMRWEIDPFLVVLTGCFIGSLLRLRKQSD